MINREIRKCFSLFIPCNPEQEMTATIEASMVVDRATKMMIQGKISPEELLEMVEPYISDMDQYIEEVELNLEEIYLGD
ncbi:MAG: hypothetical protein V7K90_18770 [Nostoc sp.]